MDNLELLKRIEEIESSIIKVMDLFNKSSEGLLKLTEIVNEMLEAK